MHNTLRSAVFGAVYVTVLNAPARGESETEVRTISKQQMQLTSLSQASDVSRHRRQQTVPVAPVTDPTEIGYEITWKWRIGLECKQREI